MKIKGHLTFKISGNAEFRKISEDQEERKEVGIESKALLTQRPLHDDHYDKGRSQLYGIFSHSENIGLCLVQIIVHIHVSQHPSPFCSGESHGNVVLIDSNLRI